VTAPTNDPNAVNEAAAGELAPTTQYVAVAAGGGTAAGLALAELDESEPIIVELDPGTNEAGDAGLEAQGSDAFEPIESIELPDGEPAEPGRPNHLRVAPDAQRGLLDRRRRAQLIVLGVAAISAASMFLLVTFHVFAAQAAFSLDKLDSQLSRQQREYALLRDQVATLSSPDAVATGAQRLGLVRAPQVTQLHPLSAPSFASTNSLPVPPLPPYSAIVNAGR
jgi:cell division protein FtsL